MSTKKNAQLTEALHGKLVVKFWSKYEPGSTHGYVLDIGSEFFLLAFIDDDLRFNGFQCMRPRDIRRLQVPDPYAEFVEAALRKRKQIIRKKPHIELGSLPELLESANKAFPLLAIHREEKSPDTCKIGKVLEIREKWLSFLEIDPNAKWDKKATRVRLSEITRVDFGGGYEEALHLVGGEPKLPKGR